MISLFLSIFSIFLIVVIDIIELENRNLSFTKNARIELCFRYVLYFKGKVERLIIVSYLLNLQLKLTTENTSLLIISCLTFFPSLQIFNQKNIYTHKNNMH